MTYDPIDTNDDGVVDADVDNQSVTTEKANIKPWKIGMLTDVHWGNTSNQGYVSQSSLESKLDAFASEMNSWGADQIIFGGDMVHEDDGSQTNTESRIANFRNYLEPQLDAPTNLVWGNHEYANPSSWGTTWAYDDWGISSTSDTYYSFDHHHAKVIVLNTGYNDGTKPDLDSWVPSGQLSWLKDELRDTTKPVIIFAHTPPAPSERLADYNIIGVSESQDYMDVISSYDNIQCVIYGHNHWMTHTQDGNPYERTHRQTYNGVPLIYQHYPHKLAGDSSITPFGKLHIHQDGHVRYEQSYIDEAVDKRGVFEFDGTVRNARPPLFDEQIQIEINDSFSSIDGYKPISNNGSVTVYDELTGVGNGTGVAEIATGPDTQNDISRLTMIREPPYRSVTGSEAAVWGYEDRIDWPDMLWWCTVECPVLADTEGFVGVGGPGTTQNHIGFRFNQDSTLDASVANGSAQSTQQISVNNRLMRLAFRLYRDEDRVDFFWNYGWDGGNKIITSNIPSRTQTGGDLQHPNELFQSFVKKTDSDTGDAKKMRFVNWGVKAGPNLGDQPL